MKAEKKYNTKAKKIAFVIKVGNIVTFKEKFWFKGTMYSQILITGVERQKRFIKLIGFGRDTAWFKSMDALLTAIDWELMERWHSF